MTSPESPSVEPTPVDPSSSFTLPEGQDSASGTSEPVDQADHSLSPRVLALWRTGWAIFGLVLVAVALALAAASTELSVPVRIAIPTVVAIAAVVVVAWAPSAVYRRWSYRLTDQSLELRHGVVVHQQSSVPYFRVQHVDVRKGLFQGWFGVVSLTVSTASPATDAELPGLEPERAEVIRRRILDRTEADDGV